MSNPRRNTSRPHFSNILSAKNVLNLLSFFFHFTVLHCFVLVYHQIPCRLWLLRGINTFTRHSMYFVLIFEGTITFIRMVLKPETENVGSKKPQLASLVSSPSVLKCLMSNCVCLRHTTATSHPAQQEKPAGSHLSCNGMW